MGISNIKSNKLYTELTIIEEGICSNINNDDGDNIADIEYIEHNTCCKTRVICTYILFTFMLLLYISSYILGGSINKASDDGWGVYYISNDTKQIQNMGWRKVFIVNIQCDKSLETIKICDDIHIYEYPTWYNKESGKRHIGYINTDHNLLKILNS